MEILLTDTEIAEDANRPINLRLLHRSQLYRIVAHVGTTSSSLEMY